MDKGVMYSAVPSCTVRVLEPLVLYLKAPIVKGALEKNVKSLPVKVARRVCIRLRVNYSALALLFLANFTTGSVY